LHICDAAQIGNLHSIECKTQMTAYADVSLNLDDEGKIIYKMTI